MDPIDLSNNGIVSLENLIGTPQRSTFIGKISLQAQRFSIQSAHLQTWSDFALGLAFD